MSRYEKILNRLEDLYGVARVQKAIADSKLFWNPLNYDDGADIADYFDVDHLMDYWIMKETGRNRWLFGFHDYALEDLSDPDFVLDKIKSCKNWKKYADIWMRRAPKRLRNKGILLIALTEITVKGFKAENAFKERMEAAGHDVRLSTPAEDARGIDFWVDGQPVQVKSERTLRRFTGGVK